MVEWARLPAPHTGNVYLDDESERAAMLALGRIIVDGQPATVRLDDDPRMLMVVFDEPYLAPAPRVVYEGAA